MVAVESFEICIGDLHCPDGLFECFEPAMTVTLLSGSVTSYSKRAEAILAQAASADIIAIKETRISMAAAFKAPAIARNFRRTIAL